MDNSFTNLIMDECPPDLQSPGEDYTGDLPRKPPVHSKGVAMSFGFKRRPNTAPIASNSNAARRLANADVIDRNGNGDTEPLTNNVAPTGRSTPRLVPPKKEGSTTRVNRFGFRQPQMNRLSKIADLNNSPIELSNNNPARNKTNRARFVDNNKNRMNSPLTEKYLLQSTQLPRPEPVRVIETKTAKTIANTSKKRANNCQEDSSSKDGSLTEDSGVGSNVSDQVAAVERLNSSPTFGRRNQRFRNLEIVNSGKTFDVRDLEDASESCAPLPQLPSAFSVSDTFRGGYHNSGYVRDMARDYQRHLDTENRRKISITSSEGFSDDYGEEEKTFRDRFNSEKSFLKPSHKNFLKSSCLKNDSSPPSSDEHHWVHGGEAMADEVSFSITSSSDESRENDHAPIRNNSITSALQTLMNASLTNSFNKNEIKNALLTIEDPKFAAVAADANTIAVFLDDETSPVDSLLSCSESDEILKKKMARSSSNSKDINEKLTPPSPGTPTNASNSLSLSDGKDDFLIDDEIADQPALVFEDAINNDFNNSESTTTIVDTSTPKPKRRTLPSVEASPLSLRKKIFRSRAGSLDTLSPCESIASDDLMMDYEYSQSSGLEDCDRNECNGFASLDDAIFRPSEQLGGLRDWGTLLGSCGTEKSSKINVSRSSRLLWSRTGTPNSISDSPKSLDSRSTAKSRQHSLTSSPLRLSRPGPLSGYDSDDSIRLDRANHTAVKQDIMSIKTMLLKLRRVLNESETHIPFDGQLTLTNGLFNGVCSGGEDDNQLELEEMRKQILFLQGQLEDREKTVLTLQDQVVRLATSNSAPASTVTSVTCNAATQTERVRPISASPSLLNGSPTDLGSLVSASESHQRRSRRSNQAECTRKTTTKLWRRPGEPPSPQRFVNHSSGPRRANSRTRTSSVPR